MTVILASLLHLNTWLPGIIASSGGWVYVGLFGLIFVETGLVVFPFLPGDSLLFLCGSLAAITTGFSLPVLLVSLAVAAVLGDFVNFEIGKRLGRHILESPRWRRWIRPEHLQRSEAFFARYGSVAIFLGRFVPIVRTLIPFTAGMSKMPYTKFAHYNVLGGVSWICVALGAGYLFGNIPTVQNHFELIMLAIVAISLIPVGIAMLRQRKSSSN